MELRLTSKYSRAERLERESGRAPVSLGCSDAEKTLSALNWPREDGMVPLNRFCARDMTARELRLPIQPIDPENRFP